MKRPLASLGIVCGLAVGQLAAGDVNAVSSLQHWSFQPIVRHETPDVANANRVRTPIDAFVLRRLEAAHLAPSPEADRETLIRRLSLDLLGLPPTIEAVAAFVNDSSTDAYERLVDRLLASPHYGERQARHWLDVARYADSNGYTIDGPRSIWKYRDWVVDAFNRDLPFDEFTIHQLAGDLLHEATTEQIVATGFHRNTLTNEEGGTDKEQFRVEAVVDRVSTTGTAFLGLTIGCARCHDHKYDPITQREFYQLFAFFNGADEPQWELPTPEEGQAREAFRGQLAALQAKLDAHDAAFLAALPEWEASLAEEQRAKLPGDVAAVLRKPHAERSNDERDKLAAEYRKTDSTRGALEQEIAKLKKTEPSVTTALVVRERDEPRATHIMIRGDFLRPGREVEPGVPAVLPQLSVESAEGAARRPNRLDFARWLVDTRNPLTARVTVNRLWQQLFGRGIVETENDFGTQGTPPTHPELLDWLASEFVANGWSYKALVRLLVTSAVYRQSSDGRPELPDIDPHNRLWARQARLRLEAEAVRDSALAASGLLSTKIGGPSVFPPQPAGVMALAQVNRPWEVSTGEDRYRRALYTYFWRSTPHPFLKTFDAPDANTTCTRRNRSNTPLQALTLLNDEAFVECAQALAARVLAEASVDDAQRIDCLMRICLSRRPTQYELMRLGKLLGQLEAEDSGVEIAKPISDRARPPASVDPATWSAWTSVARVVLNLDEFITRE